MRAESPGHWGANDGWASGIATKLGSFGAGSACSIPLATVAGAWVLADSLCWPSAGNLGLGVVSRNILIFILDWVAVIMHCRHPARLAMAVTVDLDSAATAAFPDVNRFPKPDDRGATARLASIPPRRRPGRSGELLNTVLPECVENGRGREGKGKRLNAG